MIICGTATVSGTKRPELMTSTNLHKQLATMCQVLSLSDKSGYTSELSRARHKDPSLILPLARPPSRSS